MRVRWRLNEREMEPAVRRFRCPVWKKRRRYRQNRRLPLGGILTSIPAPSGLAEALIRSGGRWLGQVRPQLPAGSSFSPVATIRSAPSGSGRCSALAFKHGALIQNSCRSVVVRMTATPTINALVANKSRASGLMTSACCALHDLNQPDKLGAEEQRDVD
jgi:hypothetical protein